MGISAKSRADAQAEAYRKHMEEQGVRARVAENIERHHVPVESGQPHKLVRGSDVDTAQAAARSGKKRARLFEALSIHGKHPEGLMDEEIAGAGGYVGGNETLRRRGAQLRAEGWTEWKRLADGTVEKRMTELGGWARVSVITAEGRRVLAEGLAE